jgi:elongation factor G
MVTTVKSLRVEDIPEALREEAAQRREELIDAATMYSDDLMEAVLEEQDIPVELIYTALREGVLQRGITPVLIGSAYKNKGVQPLLDAVTRYLPCPADVENTALDTEHDETPITLSVKQEDPTGGAGVQTGRRTIWSVDLYPCLSGTVG